MAGESLSLDIPVDRSAAFMRAAWRLLLVVAVVGLLSILRPNWRMLRLTDSASFWALAILFGFLVLLSLVLFVGGGRWLLLALWPKPVRMHVGKQAIDLNLGPFGSRVILWHEISIDFDDSLDPAEFDDVPDQALSPRLWHREAGDLFSVILRYSRVDSEALAGRLMPLIRSRGRE